MNRQTNSSTQISAIERAEQEIRQAAKDALFSQKSDASLKRKIAAIIKRACSEISIPELAKVAEKSLGQFYQRQRQLSFSINPRQTMVFLSLAKLAGDESDYTGKISVGRAREIIATSAVEEIIAPDDIILPHGNALKMYHKDYFKKHVEPTLNRMASEQAIDPESTAIMGRNTTLRSRAEREVRHAGHIARIDELKGNGVRLVIISAHADCSERCRPFQGKVFSLDGTSGKTDDGRSFEPLENATDIYTKGGKWKNGLFGFNCRHYAVEYKTGYRFPKPSAESARTEYALTQKQRGMERNVRKWRIEAEMKKGVDKDAYRRARNKAIEWNKKYQAFSRKNGLTIHPSRVKLL